MPSSKSTPAKPGGIGNEAVTKATGRGWPDWFAILDSFDVKQNGHAAAAKYLQANHAVSLWWSQSLVVGYEQARGLREKHQKTDGYSVSASKTILASTAEAFGAVHDPKARARWLPKMKWTLGKVTRGKSLRAKLTADGTPVEVMIYPKGPGKCQVTIQHNKLKSRKEALTMKDFWQAAAQRLKNQLEK
jgi:uncharacterized protein YndB with AHSA1/START domain